MSDRYEYECVVACVYIVCVYVGVCVCGMHVYKVCVSDSVNISILWCVCSMWCVCMWSVCL